MKRTHWGAPYYVARYRQLGFKKYTVISKHRTYEAAVKAMAKAFAFYNPKRADVIRCTPGSYYDPYVLCELVKL